MPGSSLWLLPPAHHPFTAPLTTLITTTLPTHFPRESASSPRVVPHFFPPHVTLTSGISPERYGDDPQGWLDETMKIWKEGGKGVRVRFEGQPGQGVVRSQEVFYRRCFLGVGFEGVGQIAGLARARGVLGEGVEMGHGEEGKGEGKGGLRFGGETEAWLEEWRREFGPHVSLMYGDEPIGDETLKKITKVVQEAGIKLEGEQSEGTEDKGWDGWDGGVVWLVPTDKPIAEWKPIATREL